MMKPRYFITELSLDADDIFWVTYIGDVPEQGGIVYGKGQVGFHNIKDALIFIEQNITKNLPQYKKLIKDKGIV